MSVSAKIITPDFARKLANDFVRSKSGEYRKAPASVSPVPVYAPQISGETAMYVFNNPGDAGFTIIAGDDELPNVIGYTTSGSFDYDKLPENMKWWLSEYEREIEYFYRKGEGARIIISREHEPVPYLMSTTWNQDAPYNNLCPMDGSARSYTGCVATAMAQVIKYHEWPPKGRGTANGVDLSQYTYEYPLMLDSYSGGATQEQCNAVATLMLHAGYSCNMNYTAYGSGANDANMHRGMMENFSYNPGTRLNFRNYINARDWDNMIYEEISSGRPVLFCGQAQGGGHCFVVDGYEGDGYYHLNWGWGGYQDGYFLLNLLNPASGGAGSFEGGYNSMQSCLTMLYPEGENNSTPQTLLVTDNAMRYDEAENALYFENNGIVYNPIGRTLTGIIGLAFEKFTDPEEVYYQDLGMVEGLGSYYGFRQLGLDDLELPADGRYKTWLYFREGDYAPERVLNPLAVPSYLGATVSGGKVTFDSSEYGDGRLVVTSICGTDAVFTGNQMHLTIGFANLAKDIFQGNIRMLIYDKTGRRVDVSQVAGVSIDGESTSSIHFASNLLKTAGEHYFVLQVDGKDICDEIPFTVHPFDSDYIIRSLRMTMISDTRFDLSGSCNTNIVVTNNSASAATFTPQINLYDEDMNLLSSAEMENTTLPGRGNLSFTVRIGDEKIVPGRYFIVVNSLENGALSPNIPVYFYRSGTEDGIVYEILSEKDATARIVAPTRGEYAESVVIPAKVEGRYDVIALDGNAMTYARHLSDVTVGDNITELPSGVFYGSGMKRLTITSQNPPVLGADAFDAEGSAYTLISLPEGQANNYKRAPGWDKFHIPSWKITASAGVTLSGLDIDKETGAIYSPYYVDSDDTPEISVDSDQPVYAVIHISDGTKHIMEVTDGKVTLPALGFEDGTCVFTDDPSGVIQNIADGGKVDVYNMQGIRVIRDAAPEDVERLPEGIYIIGGMKIIKH